MKTKFLQFFSLILIFSCNNDDTFNIQQENLTDKVLISEYGSNSIYSDFTVAPFYTYTDKFGLGITKVGSNHTLYTHVLFTEGAITYGIDTFDFFINVTQYNAPWCIYTTFPILNNKFFRNHCSTPLNTSDKMDVGLTCSEDGYYEILLHPGSSYGVFLNNQPIYLWDKVENIKVNLQETSYVFYTDAFTLKSNRFSLSYTLH